MTLSSSDTASIDTLQSRVEHLERILHGTSLHDPSSTSSSSATGPSPTSLLCQLAQIRVKLSNTWAQSPEFLDATTHLDQALQLLIQHSHDPAQIAAMSLHSSTLNQWINQVHFDHVPTSAKLAIIQTAESDLRSAASTIDRIKTWNESLNPVGLSDLSKSYAGIAQVEHQSRFTSAQVRQLETRVLQLLRTYGTYVDTLSEVFVNLDESLRTAERRVVELESRQRCERE